MIDQAEMTRRAAERAERQAAWERVRPLLPPKHLNAKGQCCGRKPIPYKRPPHLFCTKCHADFDPATGKQKTNWAYLPSGDGFVSKYPPDDWGRST